MHIPNKGRLSYYSLFLPSVLVSYSSIVSVLGIVQSVFQDHGFPDTGGQSSSFCPHLTIAKMSQSRRGRSGRRERGREGRERGCGRRQRGRRRGGRGLKGLQEELYEEFKDTEFGAEEVKFTEQRNTTFHF